SPTDDSAWGELGINSPLSTPSANDVAERAARTRRGDDPYRPARCYRHPLQTSGERSTPRAYGSGSQHMPHYGVDHILSVRFGPRGITAGRTVRALRAGAAAILVGRVAAAIVW